MFMWNFCFVTMHIVNSATWTHSVGDAEDQELFTETRVWDRYQQHIDMHLHTPFHLGAIYLGQVTFWYVFFFTIRRKLENPTLTQGQ